MHWNIVTLMSSKIWNIRHTWKQNLVSSNIPFIKTPCLVLIITEVNFIQLQSTSHSFNCLHEMQMFNVKINRLSNFKLSRNSITSRTLKNCVTLTNRTVNIPALPGRNWTSTLVTNLAPSDACELPLSVMTCYDIQINVTDGYLKKFITACYR